MSENCDQNCGSCGENCSDRKEAFHDFRANPHELSRIRNVIGVVSGKGGGGNSLVTSLLAAAL